MAMRSGEDRQGGDGSRPSFFVWERLWEESRGGVIPG
jgi:hypothetical protein